MTENTVDPPRIERRLGIDEATDFLRGTGAAVEDALAEVERLARGAERLRVAMIAWDLTLSSWCDGPERDAVRAALLEVPPRVREKQGAGK